MSDQPASLTLAVHALAAALPRHRFPVSRLDVPADGVYLLFEAGETAQVGDATVDRIVRVGTHTSEGKLARRLARHVAGDRRRSVFRLHLGGALLARDNPADPRLVTWHGDDRLPMPEVEEMITAAIRETFTLVCIPVPDKDERLDLERRLVAILAQQPLAPPSETWLGRHAARPEIRRAGLWNTQNIGADPLRVVHLERMVALVGAEKNPEQAGAVTPG